MGSKAFASFVVVFWLAMMTALVRMEFFPAPTRLTAVPANEVLRRLFDNHERQSLRMLYQGNEIGMSSLEIVPLMSSTAGPVELLSGDAHAYKVRADVKLNLNVFGTPSRFHLFSESRFDARYELKDYLLRTTVGESSVEIEGKDATKTVVMTYDVGDGPRTRTFGYEELAGPGAFAALGVPELTGLASFALPSASGRRGQEPAIRPLIRTYEDRLNIGGVSQHTFLVDCRAEENPAYWAKIWLDDQGNILLVETSVGLIMRSVTIDGVADKIVTTTTGTRLLE
jgi:hypothetical protein